MKQLLLDWKFLLGFFLAHLLLYFTYDHSKVFWYILTGATLFLISYAIVNEDIDDELSVPSYLAFGALSGALLYGLFWLGHFLFGWLNLDGLLNQVTRLYGRFSPEFIWHFVVLVLVIIPGEEFFWRGFIQKRLLNVLPVWTSVGLSAALYASVYVYSGYTVLILAAFVSGILWGTLYAWKRSLPLVIISHLTFDLLLVVFFPLL